MLDKIRSYIDYEFKEVTPGPKVMELKEELISNLTEKYEDQLAEGKSPTEAYNAAIAGIGDLSELIAGVQTQDTPDGISPAERKKYALRQALAIMLYIISPIFVLVFETIPQYENIGIMIMLLIVATATGILIYNAASRPKYQKKEETLVEDFKEWRENTDYQKAAFKSLKGAFYSIVVVIYLSISFIFGNWAYSWIIFVIAGALENIVKAIYNLRRGSRG